MMDQPEEKLSLGFFNNFASNTVPEGFCPVLQILETRRSSKDGSTSSRQTLRCRLSDGSFSSSYCMGSEEIADRFQAEGIYDSHAVIQVLEYNRRFLTGRYFFHILDYSLISFPRGTIGDPRPHNGNPEDFRGIENFSMALRAENDLAAMSLPQSRKRPGGNMDSGPNKRSGNVMSGGVFDVVTDINLITPFLSNFRICGLASGKETPREINTKRGPSKVFSFILTDEKGDGIKITAFGNECDKFSEVIENGKSFYVYCNSGTAVRDANKRFNPTSHAYELTLNSKCDVELCTDRDVQPASIKMQIIKLADIKDHANQCVDILAIVSKVEEATSINSKKGTALIKRDVYLVDDSLVQIRLTLWEEQANEFLHPIGTALALKGASVREFNGGFTLSVSGGTAIYPNLETDESQALQDWYAKNGSDLQFTNLTNEGGHAFERDFRLISHVEKSILLQEPDDKGIYVYIVATINNVKSEGAYYQACTNCRKKVVMENGQYHCDKCQSSSSFRYLYKLSVEVTDLSGTTWMSMFDECAQSFLGMDANELAKIFERDRDEYDQLLANLKLHQYEMRVRAQVETYNEQQRAKFSCTNIRPVSYERYSKIMEESAHFCQTMFPQ